jgi:hypothetical protein
MSLFDVALSLKGGSGSGNHGHAGIPGHLGGSAPTTLLAAGIVPGLPAGQYAVVHTGAKTHANVRAVIAAAKAGPGHVAVMVNGNYFVINTGNPSINPTFGVYGDKPLAQTGSTWYEKHPAVQALLAQLPSKSTQPAKTYASKVEELYDKATPEAQEYAKKYGLLAADPTAMKFLKQMESGDSNWNRNALSTRDAAYKANNQQYINKQYLAASADGKYHSEKSAAMAAKNEQSKPNDYKVVRLIDPLGRGDDGYVAASKKTKPENLPLPDPNKPDYTTMAALKTQPSNEVAKHQAHMDKTWNSHDNGQIKAKVLNAFEITMPQPLHDEYIAKRAAYGNTKFLYHGTDMNGAAGILRTGYFVGDVPKIGRIHGNGIYMADQESKSAQYAHSGSGFKLSKSRGVIFINQAAMGKEVKSSDYYTGSYGSGQDLKPGVDTFIKTSNSFGGDPYKSTASSTEYIVRDPGAIQPRIWLDIEREQR